MLTIDEAMVASEDADEGEDNGKLRGKDIAIGEFMWLQQWKIASQPHAES